MGEAGVGVAGGIGADVAGAGDAGGTSCAISAPVKISAPVASAVNNGLRDFIINSPCQNASVSSCDGLIRERPPSPVTDAITPTRVLCRCRLRILIISP
jgi:hypothetical protein